VLASTGLAKPPAGTSASTTRAIDRAEPEGAHRTSGFPAPSGLGRRATCASDLAVSGAVRPRLPR